MNLMEPDDESWPDPTQEEIAARKRQNDEWYANRQASPRMKAVIELEGPGVDGLHDAQNFLLTAGWPPYDGRTSGQFADAVLGVSCKWRIEPTYSSPVASSDVGSV